MFFTNAMLVLCLLIVINKAFANDYTSFDVVGDSISDGINPDSAEKYGWVHMLFGLDGAGQPAKSNTIFTIWPDIHATNHAVSGSKASDWAQPGALNEVISNDPDLVVLFIGGNDFFAYIADGELSPEEAYEYQTNLLTIIDTLRSNTPVPEIIIIDYYDLFDGYSTNLPAPYEAYRSMSGSAIIGNEMLRNIAESMNCYYLSIYNDFMRHCYGEELGDTEHLSPDYVDTPLTDFDIHPNTAGHNKLYERVYQQLVELKDIPKFIDLNMSTDSLTMKWSSGIAQSYVLERATNMIDPSFFLPIATNAGTPPDNVYTDTVSEIDRAFYRIRVQD